VPSTSSHAVGILSSKRSIPVPPPSSYVNVPNVGVVTAIEEAVYAALLVSAIDNTNVLPLSSSPFPVNVKPVPIPNGLPVTSASKDVYVAVTDPATSIEPAFAAATDARDPHNADTPIFVNLFINYSFLLPNF
jgi:hypothetical protein